MSRKRILFVDDKAEVLAALRAALRRDADRWDMVFATSGEAALDAMNHGTFDMVITDLRMPGIDGAAVLSYTRRRSPRTIRLMLSGSGDFEASEVANGVIDQLLAKPCRTPALRATIESWFDRARLDA
jgi:DNA-binding NtrC family response regulator